MSSPFKNSQEPQIEQVYDPANENASDQITVSLIVAQENPEYTPPQHTPNTQQTFQNSSQNSSQNTSFITYQVTQATSQNNSEIRSDISQHPFSKPFQDESSNQNALQQGTINQSQNQSQNLSQRRIKKLPPHIVNKIAAGEVIQYPASMAKELLENSLDAASTRITIRVQNGGLEKFIISDNGHGISHEDLPLVCMRHTTSKLRSLDDLMNIGTYGFRGEALASVSCVAHVKIISKTQEQSCAYKASFVNNRIFPENEKPSPIAGSNGTIIEVERLFHDNEIRFQAQKHTQELKRMVTCIQKYALHNHHVQITFKKIVSQKKDELIFTTPSNSNFLKNLRVLYGKEVAASVMNIEASDERLDFKCNAYVSNPQYSAIHSQCIIFINNRLVKCQTLKRDIEAILEPYLPMKKKPFVYISLTLNPNTVDVNCHPAKEQVGFLHEDEIIAKICEKIKEKLDNSNDSRVLYTQRSLSMNSLSASGGLQMPTGQSQSSIDIPWNSQSAKLTTDQASAPKPTYDYNKVRITSNDQVGDLDRYIPPHSSILRTSITSNPNVLLGTKRPLEVSTNSEKRRRFDNESDPSNNFDQGNNTSSISVANANMEDVEDDEEGDLESVYNLLDQVERGSSRQLQEILRKHVFVGWVSPRMILLQHETSLYSLDPVTLSRALLYQAILRNIKKLDRMCMETPLSLRRILTYTIGEKECTSCLSILKWGFVAELLSSYYSLDIDITPEDDALLKSIPVILPNYIPPLHRLPMLIYQLTHEVDWKVEKECIHDTAIYIAEFYELCHEEETLPDDSVNDLNYENSSSQMELTNGSTQSTILKYGYTESTLKWVTQYIVLDAVRNPSLFVPPKDLQVAAEIKLVTQLSKLYQVFDRC